MRIKADIEITEGNRSSELGELVRALEPLLFAIMGRTDARDAEYSSETPTSTPNVRPNA